jgi:four helix bundle protein
VFGSCRILPEYVVTTFYFLPRCRAELTFPSLCQRHEPCSLPDVAGAKRFEELLAWQRMNELSVEVWRSTAAGPAFRDFKFRDQIRDASDSAARNIAEGFGRFSPAQFAHFLDISRGSAQETRALLRKGLSVGYWRPEEYKRLDTLAIRGIQATARLQRYLRSPQARRNAAGRYR